MKNMLENINKTKEEIQELEKQQNQKYESLIVLMESALSRGLTETEKDVIFDHVYNDFGPSSKKILDMFKE